MVLSFDWRFVVRLREERRRKMFEAIDKLAATSD